MSIRCLGELRCLAILLLLCCSSVLLLFCCGGDDDLIMCTLSLYISSISGVTPTPLTLTGYAPIAQPGCPRTAGLTSTHSLLLPDLAVRRCLFFGLPSEAAFAFSLLSLPFLDASSVGLSLEAVRAAFTTPSMAAFFLLELFPEGAQANP